MTADGDTLGVRKALPWGFLGMLALVWVGEGAVARFGGDFLPMLSCCWRDAARAATHEAVGSEVLCLGDSQVKLGVLPRAVEAETGRSVYNLAVHRGSPASSYFLLRRALDAGARPRAAVVDFSPGLLATPLRYNAPLWPHLAGPRDLFNLFIHSRDPHLAAQILAGWLLPSVEARDGIRDAVVASLRGEESPLKRSTQDYRRDWTVHRGAQPHPPRPGFTDPESRAAAPAWRCRRENEVYVRKFLSLAAEHRITVYLLIPPFSPATQARRNRNGQEAAFDRFVEGLLRGAPGFTVVDGRGLGLEKTDFIDPVHVNERGASRLSAALAAVLATGGPAPGWVELRPPTGDGRPSIAVREITRRR